MGKFVFSKIMSIFVSYKSNVIERFIILKIWINIKCILIFDLSIYNDWRRHFTNIDKFT